MLETWKYSLIFKVIRSSVHILAVLQYHDARHLLDHSPLHACISRLHAEMKFVSCDVQSSRHTRSIRLPPPLV